MNRAAFLRLTNASLIDCCVCLTGAGSLMDILRHGDESSDIEGVKDGACQLVAGRLYRLLFKSAAEVSAYLQYFKSQFRKKDVGEKNIPMPSSFPGLMLDLQCLQTAVTTAQSYTEECDTSKNLTVKR